MPPPPTITQNLFSYLTVFTHPAIDTSNTQVCARLSTASKWTLNLRLYHNPTQEYVPEDRITTIPDVPLLPGISFGIDEQNKNLEIKSIYLKPKFQGSRLGTSLISSLLENAPQLGIETIDLLADEQTNARDYWTKIHGFITPRLDQPQFCYKKISLQ